MCLHSAAKDWFTYMVDRLTHLEAPIVMWLLSLLALVGAGVYLWLSERRRK